ncbi:MFS transporter, partial [Streptomyces scabiei]|nr:MFS transporter [Streptomyces scabiei]
PDDRAKAPSPTVPDPMGKRPFPWRPLAGTCALTVFGAVLFYTLQVEMAFLLDDMGVTETSMIGLAAAITSAAIVAGSVVFTKTGRTPQAWLPTAFGLCAAGFAVVWLAPNPVLLTIGAVINCLGGGIMLPSLLTLAMSKLEFADRGRGIGLWTGSFFLGQFLCPLVVLALTSVVGSTAKSMGVLALSGAVASAALGLAARRRRTGAVPAPIQQIAG